MKIKKRVTRKTEVTKEAEDLQEILQDIKSRSSGAVEKYRLTAIIVVSAIVIIAAVAVSYRLLSARWDRAASVLQYKAYNLFLEGRYTESISSFQEIADKYSRSKSAPVALYYIGNSYSALGQYDDAIRSYRSFIEKYPGDEGMLPLVYLNLGAAYTDMGDYSNAIAAYRNVVSMKDTFAADRAVYETGRVYEASGDKASAIEQYENLTKSYVASSWGQEAKARLTVLKGNVPVQTGEHKQENLKQEPAGKGKK